GRRRKGKKGRRPPPPAPTPGGPRAAPNKQKLRRPTDRARFVVLPRPLGERRRARERAAEDRDCNLRRRLFLVRRGRFRQGRGRDQHHLGLYRRAHPQTHPPGGIPRRPPPPPSAGDRGRTPPRERRE